MKVTITILDKNDIRLDLAGFTPGETVWFRFQLSHATGGRTYEFYPIATVGEDGRFSSTESFEDIIPNRPDPWDVRVVHSRGVACTQATMP